LSTYDKKVNNTITIASNVPIKIKLLINILLLFFLVFSSKSLKLILSILLLISFLIIILSFLGIPLKTLPINELTKNSI